MTNVGLQIWEYRVSNKDPKVIGELIVGSNNDKVLNTVWCIALYFILQSGSWKLHVNS